VILLFPALLILAALGAYSIVTSAFSPWHWLLIAAEFGGVVLLLRLGWVLIGNLRKGTK
jgi:hypothetical protein